MAVQTTQQSGSATLEERNQEIPGYIQFEVDALAVSLGAT